ncbi:metal dependent phosphohydrolase [Gemmatirosa kalamazoonensis]|uniref:Metal dependent phosphohydrolase n=1 Tax=Gemmatirosa kalamazoonensis TaxID=861299 RepID=W0RJD9_9BACT|nr:HDIG domain-containing metalloprotein [Gemmatirosa kalamazoonensis]AHG90891.1 metal dependent phosphohydrolase [Gemmatirosa kalamazoonensis]
MGTWGQAEPSGDDGGRSRTLGTLGAHGARLAIALALAIGAFLLFPLAPAVELPLYEVGAVAPENVIAPFAFRVPKTDAQLQGERDAARRAEPLVLDLVPAALDTSRTQLAAFARVLEQAYGAAGTAAGPAVAAAASQVGIRLTPAEIAYLHAPTRRRAQIEAVQRVLDRWLPGGVASTTALTDARGQVAIAQGGHTTIVPADSVMTFASLLARARRAHPDPTNDVGDALYVKLLSGFFRPTLVADRAATDRMREAAAIAVERDRYFVRAGEKIVGAHEVVGREANDKMRALRDATQLRGGTEVSSTRAAARVVGSVLHNLIILVVFGVTLLLFRPQLYAQMRVVLLFALEFALVLGTAALVARMPTPRPEIVPVALAAVMLSILFDPRISLIAAMVLAVLVGSQGPFRGTNALFILLVGGVAAAVSVQTVRRRNQAYLSMLIVAAGYALAALALGLTLGWTWRELGLMVGFGTLGAVVSVALAMGLMPPAEEFTGTVTYLRLLEWSDLNRPLMQRLSLEAPGTYAHTIATANLAEQACNAIGANGLLARVGTYYHDIGKLKKPQFFVENQARGRNPHDKLKPNTSASIIKNHVKEGLELADEIKLPKPLRAFIVEHHGTGRIGYFMEKARERGDALPNAGEYAYPGPIPQTAETAVLMLADGVEASARALPDPTPQKIRELVEHVVRQRMEQGQLRDAPLTLRQIELVKEQFVRVLLGMHHNRIEYPTAAGGVGTTGAVNAETAPA